MKPKGFISVILFFIKGVVLTLLIISILFFLTRNFSELKNNPNITLVFLIPGAIMLFARIYKAIHK